eukprot:30961-Pelagococcus_subviridis.AAC.16
MTSSPNPSCPASPVPQRKDSPCFAIAPAAANVAAASRSIAAATSAYSFCRGDGEDGGTDLREEKKTNEIGGSKSRVRRRAAGGASKTILAARDAPGAAWRTSRSPRPLCRTFAWDSASASASGPRRTDR